MRYVYLHGFASSPLSSKAQAFRAAFEARGVKLEIPVLDGGDFEHLTISSQMTIVEDLLQGAEACLLGSSMGGFLAAFYASRHPEVRRLVLLAPAFAFAERWDHLAGPENLARWKESGYLNVFHYGEKRDRGIHYGLYSEALTLPRHPDFSQPTLIFHGVNDDVVPVKLSREFASTHPHVDLRELPTGHELLDGLGKTVQTGVEFLLGPT